MIFSNRVKKIFAVIFTIATAVIFTSCNSTSTDMSFSFNTSTPSDSSDKKTICFNEDYKSVTLNTNLQIDSGSLMIQVCDSNGDIIFSDKYEKSGNYDINLENVSADKDYIIKVQTEQSKNVKLNIFSSVKLVKDKEKPELKTIINNT